MKPDRPSVLILHNVPPEDPATGKPVPWVESDAGVMIEVEAAARALDALGYAHRTVGVSGLADVPRLLAGAPEPVVLNLVEGFAGAPADATYVPALCRAFGKGCTGNDTPCQVAALDKGLTKAVLLAAGLPCPRGVVVPVGEKVPAARLGRGPFIVKPAGSDASEGIDGDSVVKAAGPALAKAVRRVHEEIGQAAIVEQFLSGREFNVAIIERRGAVQVLPISEIDFSAFPKGRPRLVDYAAKWLPDSIEFKSTPRILPVRVTSEQARAINALALGAWLAVGCRDYARVDLRMDARGRVYILEVNPNPDISPEDGFAAALEAAKIPYEKFVAMMVDNALGRVAKNAAGKKGTAPVSSRKPKKPPALRPRWNEPRDRDVVLEFMRATAFFRPDEIDIAAELLDESIAKGTRSCYQSFVTDDENGRAVGWVCFGATPCTVGTYDIYWIGVAPQRQGRGLGAALMDFAEREIANRGGRLSVVETSGRAIYHPTRQFYLRLGYHEAARITDFYAPGDDKIVYTKRLE